MTEWIDKAGAQDITALCEIWKDAFAEEGDFAGRFLALCITHGRVMVCYDPMPVAMGCMVPLYDEDGQRGGWYVYALCTARARRGEGLCTRLLRAMKAQGQMLCLLPASAALADFYRARGFVHPVWMAVAVADTPVAAEPLCASLHAPQVFDDLILEALREGRPMGERAGWRYRTAMCGGRRIGLITEEAALATDGTHTHLGLLPI